MLNNLKNNFHWILYMLGLTAYVITIIINPDLFYNAIIGMIVILYFWVILSFLNSQYNLKQFVLMISVTGITIAISTFFIYGVSEIATDYQQSKNGILYDFNSEAISISLALLFIFTLPIIILQLSNTQNSLGAFIEHHPNLSPNDYKKNIKTEQTNQKEWEEATAEDLDSGKYEVI